MRGKFDGMKEKLSFVMGVVFLPFVGVVFYLPEFWRQTKACVKRNKKNFIRLGIAALIIASWVLGTGLTIVKPNTCQIVRVPERVGAFKFFDKPVAFLNDSDRTRFFLSCPRIPFTNIGSKEETYSLSEPINFGIKTELFSMADITKNPEDKNKIVYLVVSGTGEVSDWDEFISDGEGYYWETYFYPELAKEKNIQRDNLVKLMLAEDLKSYFLDDFQDWFLEYATRLAYVEQIKKYHNLNSPEEIENFIKTHEPWYWAAGPLMINALYEEGKKAYPNSMVLEIAQIYMAADLFERGLVETDADIYGIEAQIDHLAKIFGEGEIKKAQTLVSQYREYLESTDTNFFVVDAKDFEAYLEKGQYSTEEIFISRLFFDLEQRKEWKLVVKDSLEEELNKLKDRFTSDSTLGHFKSEGNASLWRTVIEEAVKNSDGPIDIGSYLAWFKDNGGKYFEEIFSRVRLVSLESRYGVKFDLSFQVIEESAAEAK